MKHIIILFLLTISTCVAQTQYARVDSLRSSSLLSGPELTGYNFLIEFHDIVLDSTGTDTVYVEMKYDKDSSATAWYPAAVYTLYNSFLADYEGKIVLSDTGQILRYVVDFPKLATIRLVRKSLKMGVAVWYKISWFDKPIGG